MVTTAINTDSTKTYNIYRSFRTKRLNNKEMMANIASVSDTTSAYDTYRSIRRHRIDNMELMTYIATLYGFNSAIDEFEVMRGERINNRELMSYNGLRFGRQQTLDEYNHFKHKRLSNVELMVYNSLKIYEQLTVMFEDQISTDNDRQIILDISREIVISEYNYFKNEVANPEFMTGIVSQAFNNSYDMEFPSLMVPIAALGGGRK